MAQPDQHLVISIEATLHKAIKDYVEAIGSIHGVYIQSIHIDWLEIRETQALHVMSQVHHVRIETKSHGDNK